MAERFQKLANIPTSEPIYHSLEVADGQGGRSVVPLTGDSLVIGRSSEAQLKLEGEGVSRRHAELYRDPFGRWWIRDLGSSNGTLVNGFATAERMLELDDVIAIGDHALSLASSQNVQADEPESVGPGVTVNAGKSGTINLLGEAAPPQISAAHLDTLMTLSRRMHATERLSRRRDMLCAMMVGEQFGGWSAVVIRLDRTASGQEPRTLCQPQTQPLWHGRSLYITAGLIEGLCREPQPMLARDIDSGTAAIDESGPGNAKAAALSAIACPLDVTDEALDVLYVIVPPSHGTMQWLTLVKLAAELFLQAQVTWQTRRLAYTNSMVEHDLERGRAIQLRLVPQGVKIPQMDIAIRFQPCRWVAGDYVDVVASAEGQRWLLVIADVCGKGLPAALVASSMHTMVHTFIRAGIELQSMVAMINEHLFEHLPANRFVTGIFVEIDPLSGALRYVNAGHPAPIIVSGDGPRRPLPSGHDEPMGLTRVNYRVGNDRLEAGQMLAMFTDGITELKDQSGRMLTDYRVGEHLRQIFSADPQAPAEQVADQFNQVLDGYQGDSLQTDDRTFLLAKKL
jgi:sigma-B regulation protein RsbU (phosphoserine phosphatase)